MICSKCGRTDDEGNRFCTYCGAPVVAIQVPSPLPPTEIVTAQQSQPPDTYPAGQFGDRLIGQTIDSKYRIDARIGVGGMGIVYRAIRLMIGDKVAVKVMHPEHSTALQAIERFRREARAAARLKHPNAVTIYDFGVSPSGMLYLVMELVEGENLRGLIQRQGPFTPRDAAEILNQVAAALDEAHRDNIVHRDLKPDNIIVQTTPHRLRVKVLDFGIAKMRDLQTLDALTQTGALIGTPYYMSPEQCVGEELDGRSDIYSLGIVLFEMLTGAIPFNAPSASAVLIQHIQQPPPSPRSIYLNIPPAVESVVMHALQKHHGARPQTAGEMARELMAAIMEQSPQGVRTAMPHPAPSTQPAPRPDQLFVSPPNLSPNAQTNRTPAEGIHGAPPHSMPAPVLFESPPRARNRKPLIIGLFVAALLILSLGGGYFLLFAAKTSIISEIRKGNLVRPEGSSAYDLYRKNRSRLSGADVTEISNEIIPKLEIRGNEIINNLKAETTNESEAGWSEAIRVFDWLNELRADKKYEARKYFSQARMDFLKKDYRNSISGFRRAAELDPSWGMAYNGLA